MINHEWQCGIELRTTGLRGSCTRSWHWASPSQAKRKEALGFCWQQIREGRSEHGPLREKAPKTETKKEWHHRFTRLVRYLTLRYRRLRELGNTHTDRLQFLNSSSRRVFDDGTTFGNAPVAAFTQLLKIWLIVFTVDADCGSVHDKGSSLVQILCTFSRRYWLRQSRSF